MDDLLNELVLGYPAEIKGKLGNHAGDMYMIVLTKNDGLVVGQLMGKELRYPGFVVPYLGTPVVALPRTFATYDIAARICHRMQAGTDRRQLFGIWSRLTNYQTDSQRATAADDRGMHDLIERMQRIRAELPKLRAAAVALEAAGLQWDGQCWVGMAGTCAP